MDDKDQSLHKLSLPHRESIISQLVDIGSESNQQEHAKYLPFVQYLQCLRPEGLELRRTSINAFYEKQYIALSYTWDASEYEDDESGRYHVEGWNDNGLEQSKVRNCVLDRVVSYMRYTNMQLLWIDRHCIRQDVCDDACTHHIHCTQKRDAMQAMDLVYQFSSHPVAVLGRPVQIESELHILADVLSGALVVGDSEPRLSGKTTIREARKALYLLHEITQDRWWHRAWTFQENYRGGVRMQLLIRHNPSLERQKLRHRVFGNIPGELCVPSVDFSREATRLCLAFRRVQDISWISDVLRTAGRYADMLHESSPMTPTVVADIEARELKVPWDRLAIIANCCRYSVRLDGEALVQQGHSLSLSVLAMCLLNGEILNNNDEGLKPIALLTVSEFLKEQLFKAFSAPEDDTRKLTFNKGCRLTDVKLTSDGILTKGHLWKLGRVVDTAMFRRKLPWIDNPNGQLTLTQRKGLLQQVFRLCDLKYRSLAHRIDEYLDADAKARDAGTSFTEIYLHGMACELAAAIRARRKLRLGCIWDPSGRPAPYRAVFMWSNEDGDRSEAYPPPAFVFTSAWSRDLGSEVHDANDIDRHVSLEVDLEELLISDGTPRLRTRSWLLGMCFFNECPRTKVLFPWPRALQAVKL
ncbi:hypothetical protein DL766_002068 [Monosporascus sp. MC13-8B]|nr:hypothetical protein DL766_002068 [Monosporascus sp. MC13-8B]